MVVFDVIAHQRLGQVEDAFDRLAVPGDKPVRMLGGQLGGLARALDLHPQAAEQALAAGVGEDREEVVGQAVAGLPVAAGVRPGRVGVGIPSGIDHEEFGADFGSDVDLAQQALFAQFVLHVAPVVVDDRLPAVANPVEHVTAQVGMPALDRVVKAHMIEAEVDLRQHDALARGDHAHRCGSPLGRAANTSRLVPVVAPIVAAKAHAPVGRPGQADQKVAAVDIVVRYGERGRVAAAPAQRAERQFRVQRYLLPLEVAFVAPFHILHPADAVRHPTPVVQILTQVVDHRPDRARQRRQRRSSSRSRSARCW